MKYLLLAFNIIFCICLSAQATLTVELSADTIGMEDAVKVTYTLSGAQEKIDILPWEGLQQVAGPNVSSSFSFVNGVSNQSYSESYILVPKYEGTIYIPSASIVIDGEPLETEPIELFVVAEPTYQQQSKAIHRKSTKKLPAKKKADDEKEYQRLLKKRELAKKKKKF